MNIYSPTVITEKMEQQFIPSRLYIKELVGQKYFGVTARQDITVYSGSGTIWQKRIKKYGKENINTIWISDWFDCPYQLQEFALLFSELHMIVESDDWDNLKAENGLTGGSNGPCHHSTKIKIGNGNRGKKYSAEVNAKKSSPGDKNGMYGIHRFGESSPHHNKLHSSSTKEILSIKAKNRARLICPYCSKEADAANAHKHHFDNCTKSPLFDPITHAQKKMIGRVCRLDTRKELDCGNWALYIKSLVL